MRKYKTLREIPISILKEVVKENKSFRSIRTEFNLSNIRCNRNEILKEILNKNNIDYSHFTGHAWNKGMHFNIEIRKKKFIKEKLVKGGKIRSSYIKENLLLFDLIENKCYECELKPIWNNKKLVMHLEHKNGNNLDNRIENLTLLCPNCHSQTETYCRGQGKYLKKTKNQIINEELFKERKSKLKQINLNDPNWINKLSKLWNVSLGGVKGYIREYFPEIHEKTFKKGKKRNGRLIKINKSVRSNSKEIKKMFNDNFKKDDICNKFNISSRQLDDFLKANDLKRRSLSKLSEDVIKKRSKDFFGIEKKNGYINKLSKKWNISHTQVRRYIQKKFPRTLVKLNKLR